MMRAQRGFTLAELVVTLVISSVLGLALARLVISQSRFVAGNDAVRNARQGSRAALNMMFTDLRMVSGGGLVLADGDSVTVRVPYAFGLACRQSGGSQFASLLPTDSAAYASATAGGYAWRDSTAAYQFVTPVTVASASGTECADSGITTLAGGRRVALTPNVVGVPVGSVIYLYQLLRYALAPSGEIPGRRGLYRQALPSGTREEIVTPFDSSAGFEFLVGPQLTQQATPPADLSTVRGLRLKLRGASEQTPIGRTTPVTFDLSTTVLFRNVAQ